MSAPEGPASLVGQRLAGRYRITRHLASGGMGAVYIGVQEALDREVVIKVVRAELVDASFVDRFNAEALATSRLSHPNIVTVHDFGVDADVPFLVFERLEGRSLQEVLSAGPLPWPRAVRVLRDIAAALAEAARCGIVHRDLKPSNVFIVDKPGADLAKVLDFGIAKILNPSGDGGTDTTAGLVVGTPGFIAPERLLGGQADARADLYALGVVAWHMMAGHGPFVAADRASLISKHISAPVPRLSSAAAVPPALDDLVAGLLAKRAEQRPGSALAVLDALAAIANAAAPGDTTRVVDADAGERKLERVARRLTLALGVAAAAVLAVAGWQPRATVAGAGTLSPGGAVAVDASLIRPLPPAPRLDVDVVGIGRALYHDAALSEAGKVSCASCHPVDHFGTTAEGLTTRGADGRAVSWNTPTTFDAALHYRQTWKGELYDVESSIERAIFSPGFIGASSWPAIMTRLRGRGYAPRFERAHVTFDRDGVKRALGAYVRSLSPRGAPWDRYAAGDGMAIASAAIAGARLFVDYGCIGCHQGSGVGGNMVARFGLVDDPYADRGQCKDQSYCRADDDCADRACAKPAPVRRGIDDGVMRGEIARMFRVPSLRNAAGSAPYFHDGSARTLSQAIRTMGRVQLGRTLTGDEVDEIEAFINSLSAPLPKEEIELAALEHR